MKNSTLLLLGAFFLSSTINAQQRFVKNNVKNSKAETTYAHPKAKAAESNSKFSFIKRSEGKSVWKPSTETEYEYMESTWEELGTTEYEYDGNGNITNAISDDGMSKSRKRYNYDQYNNKIEEISQNWENDAWVNSEKKQYVYDDVITDYQTEYSVYSWDAVNDQWITNYAHKKIITRNDKGYITSLSINLLYEGEYEELEKTVIAYTDGSELPATTWTYYELTEDNPGVLAMKEVTKYENMKWESCDGQIVATDEDFMIGNNRLKAAKIYDYQEETAKFEASYPEGNKKKDYDVTISSISGPDKIIHKLTELDDNGSYIYKYIESLDENEDGNMEEYEVHFKAMYDSHKNVISEESFVIMDDMEEQVEGLKIDYTYGDRDEILEFIESGWNYDETTYEPIMKIVSSNFIEIITTSITNTEINNAFNCYVDGNSLVFSLDGASQYNLYNLSGTEVEKRNMNSNMIVTNLSHLPNGIYILVVSGSKGTAKAKFVKK